MGTVLAILRKDIPYIPTAKEAVRGRFLRLAWPSLVLIGIYFVTLLRVIYLRMRSSEGSLELSSEAVWGMLGFATIPVIAAIGSLYAAWQARVTPSHAPWDDVNIDEIGGAQ
jgi:cellulose synthase (UDP-forming)